MSVDPHRIAEARSLALHRAIAAALIADPALVNEARERVRMWLASGLLARPYAEAWLVILEAPVDEIGRAITEDSDAARALRQTTPFAGAIDPRTRWRIWDEVRDEMSGASGSGR